MKQALFYERPGPIIPVLDETSFDGVVSDIANKPLPFMFTKLMIERLPLPEGTSPLQD
jgi:hypothetical protein